MPARTVNRWLAVRLEFLGSCLMLSTVLISVSAVAISTRIDAGLVGLMMTYASSVTGTLVCEPANPHLSNPADICRTGWFEVHRT
jgi:hypothetical protein